jgi:WD40 repeat protein/pimeloyl-ACP methyl ester carboxylesterase
MTADTPAHVVVTVHGIRTFGRWAADLGLLLAGSKTPPRLLSYKYGLFSFLAFSIPFIRRRRVRRFAAELKAWRTKYPSARFDIVAHSFGTFLVAHALLDDDTLRVDTVILSGSVLQPDFPWHRILPDKRAGRVVNECGDSDVPLIASQFFVWGTGMAGRLGFRAMTGTDAGLTNRFYRGGHSLYFERPGFMAAHWVPLLTTDEPVADIDERDPPTVFRTALVVAVQNATFIKAAGYCAVAAFLVLAIRDYRTSTRQAAARQLAIQADVARDQQSNPTLGGLLAIESLRIAPTEEGERALRRTLSQLPVRLRRFTTFANPPTAAIGERARNIAVVTHGSDVDISRMSDGQPMNVLRHPDDVDGLSVSADGRFVATAAGGWLYVWEAREARIAGRIRSRVPLGRLDVSSDGSRVLEVRPGSVVDMRLLDVKTGGVVKHIELPDGGVTDTAFSVDGRLVAIAVAHRLFPQAGGIRVWNALTGEPKPALTREGDAAAVAISPDSTWIAAGYDSGTIRAWEVEGKGNIEVSAGSPVRALVFSPKVVPSDDPSRGDAVPEGTRGEWLASLSDDAVRVWNMLTATQRGFVAAGAAVEAIAFSPEAERLATLRANSAWDMWTPVAPFSVAPRHSSPVLAAGISCHRNALLTAGEDGTLRAWDAATGRALEANSLFNFVVGREERFHAAAYVCDEGKDWLAVIPQFGLPLRSVSLVDPRTIGYLRGKPIGEAVSVMAPSPGGRSIALGTEGGSITVWTLAERLHGTPQLRSTFIYGGILRAIAINADGSTVAAAGRSGVRVWSSSRGAASIDVSRGASSVSTDDAGRYVAIGGDDRRTRVLDVTTGQVVRTIESRSPIRAVQLRGDGSVLAVAATGVDVFETATGNAMGRIADARDVDQLFFTRDGRSLVTIAREIVDVKPWSLDDLIAEGCARIARNLTDAEWGRYFGTRRYAPTCPGEPPPAVRR